MAPNQIENETAIRNDIKSSNNEIQSLSIEISELNAKNSVLSDSIGKM
jgi:hypothetical protein